MNRLKIWKRLTLSFAVVLVVLIGMNAVALSSVRKLGNSTENLFNYAFGISNNIWESRRSVEAMEKYLVEGLLSPEIMEERFKKASEESDLLLKNINELKSNTEDASLSGTELDKFGSITMELGSLRNQIQDTALAGDIATATKIFNEQFRPKLESVVSTVTDSLAQANQTAVVLLEGSQSEMTNTITWMNIFFGAIVVIIVVVALMTIKGITNPINKILKVVRELANGNLDVSAEVSGNDEIAELAKGLNITIGTLKEYVEDISSTLDEVSRNNLDIQSNTKYVGAFIPIGESIGNIVKSLNRVLFQIGNSAKRVEQSSSQSSMGAQLLSEGATEQASSVESLALTLDTISVQINDNAQNASKARQEVAHTSSEVEEGNEHMKSMIVAMQEISNASDQIAKIIKTIEDIAFQTNILALNAAVEAARAGEAGKGFAVVADEVRNLAGKSAEAAKDTTNLIQSTIDAVNKGSGIADATAQSMHMVVEGTKRVSSFVENIASASAEQADSIARVSKNLERISEVVSTNSATSEQSAATSAELLSQAQVLNSLVDQFRLKQDSYIG